MLLQLQQERLQQEKVYLCGGLLLCQKFKEKREETAWKRRRIETSLVVFILCYVCWHTLFLVNCFGIELVLCDCISRGLIWQRVCYLTLFSLLLCTNCVVGITEYWSSSNFQYQWIGRQNKKLETKFTTEWLKRRKMRRRQDFSMK